MADGLTSQVGPYYLWPPPPPPLGPGGGELVIKVPPAPVLPRPVFPAFVPLPALVPVVPFPAPAAVTPLVALFAVDAALVAVCAKAKLTQAIHPQATAITIVARNVLEVFMALPFKVRANL